MIAVVPNNEVAHAGVGKDHALDDIYSAADAGKRQPRQTRGRAAAEPSLGRGQADVAGDPAGVGASGDVEVAEGVDRVPAIVEKRPVKEKRGGLVA